MTTSSRSLTSATIAVSGRVPNVGVSSKSTPTFVSVAGRTISTIFSLTFAGHRRPDPFINRDDGVVVRLGSLNKMRTIHSITFWTRRHHSNGRVDLQDDITGERREIEPPNTTDADHNDDIERSL